MRYAVVNLGCKVNRVESDAFERELLSLGGVPSAPESADVVVVNTCAVTTEAEKKTRKAVRRAVRDAAGPVVVTGCAAALSADAYRAIGGNVVVVPKDRVASALRELAGAIGAQVADSRETDASGISVPPAQPDAVAAGAGPFAAKPAPERPGQFAQRARVGVKVQDGCDNACSYCVIHIARGPARSVPADEVEAECVRLARAGVREIVLTGINLGTYRDAAGEGTDLRGLLERLLAATAPIHGAGELPCRFRLSSIEPNDLSDGLLELIAEQEGRVCRHLHLPLQAGATKVLREMNRPYTAEDYRELVRRIRSAVPGASITTDVIVGFPGETDEEFERTVSLCRECGFSRIHVFPYSRRRGTPAAERADQVPEGTKADRARRLRRVAAELSGADLRSRAGTREWVLVEVPGEAMTESYHGVFAPPASRVGELVSVTL